MESAWLAAGARAADPDRPMVVARVVLDGPRHELRSLKAPRRLMAATRRLRELAPVLERWARATGPRHVILAAPRSFCAGVERAIDIVERAIDRFPPPVYVRRQIVHNTHVVAALERRGAIFVEELDQVPPGSTVILAAHGVSPAVRAEAETRQLRVIDATCPLVAKVHAEARRFAARDFDIVLIGHAEHEEIQGTTGEAPERITVVSSTAEIDALSVADPERVAYLTQTTLAVDQTAEIVDRLRERFPAAVGPHTDDICYATQNRQEALAAVAARSDVVLVVGSTNSSNSMRLAEVAKRSGCRAYLVDGTADLRLGWLADAPTVGISAGASAPEDKVLEVVAALRALGTVTVEELRVREETLAFSVPPEVR
jgi:4-hydroxy-3-methylbut-2-enyl diphosphate reductase